ncbi:MAG: ribonuclease HI family protein [candidate division WOR-3 bacterium]|nr:ribonuclease HI family protein [candidate division WOR-3 bacterium]
MNRNYSKIIIHIDGASKGNPGPAGIGIVLENEAKQPLKEISKFIGNRTNNQAEYEALITALTTLGQMLKSGLVNYDTEIIIKTDSELLFKQINGLYKIRNRGLQNFYFEAMWLKNQWKNLKIIQVSREENRQSDRLAKNAIRAYLKGKKEY